MSSILSTQLSRCSKYALVWSLKMNFLKEDDHLEQQQSQPTYQADPLHTPPLLVNRLIKHKYLSTSLVGMWDNTLCVVLAWIYHSSDVTRITQFGLFAEDLNNNIMFAHQLQLNCFTLSICIERVGIISNLWLKDGIAVTTMSSHQSQTNKSKTTPGSISATFFTLYHYL